MGEKDTVSKALLKRIVVYLARYLLDMEIEAIEVLETETQRIDRTTDGLVRRRPACVHHRGRVRQIAARPVCRAWRRSYKRRSLQPRSALRAYYWPLLGARYTHVSANPPGPHRHCPPQRLFRVATRR